MAIAPQMTDQELRGLLLGKFYEKRKGPRVSLNDLNLSPEVCGDAGRICEQLAEDGLIEWKSVKVRGGFIANGFGTITGRGVKVIEGVETASVPITIVGSHNIVGDRNVQINDVTIGQIAQAINCSTASPEKKEEAKNTIVKAFKDIVVKDVLGTVAESVTKAMLSSASGGS